MTADLKNAYPDQPRSYDVLVCPDCNGIPALHPQLTDEQKKELDADFERVGVLSKEVVDSWVKRRNISIDHDAKEDLAFLIKGIYYQGQGSMLSQMDISFTKVTDKIDSVTKQKAV